MQDQQQNPLAAGDTSAADAVPDTASAAIAPVNAAVSLGKVLRTAREQRGLSLSDVAQAIKFSQRQIEAVEAEDFAQLSGATFLRGMIRSYARLLHLDVDALLAQLEPHAPQVQSVMPIPPDTGMAMPLPGGGNRYAAYLKPVLLAGVLLSVAGSYFYWIGQDADPAPQAVAGAQATPDAAAQPAAVVPPLATVEPAAVPSALETTAAPADPASAANSAALPGPETSQLIFTFEGKSWVEVKDASKQVIFAQNNPAGSRQVVSGKPPFDLVIGSAGHVRLQYDERQVDLLPHTRVDVARLVLE